MPSLRLALLLAGLSIAIFTVGGVEPVGLLVANIVLVLSALAQLHATQRSVPSLITPSKVVPSNRYLWLPLLLSVPIVIVGLFRCAFDSLVFAGLVPENVNPSVTECSLTALPTLAGICLGIIVFWIAWGCDRRDKRAIGYFFYFALCFELIYGIYALEAGSVSVLGIGDRSGTNFVTGTFGNRNNFGVFVSMTTPIAISVCVFNRRLPLILRIVALVLITMLIGVALISSASRLGIASFFFGLALWVALSIRNVHLWTRSRRIAVAIAFVLGVFIVGVWFGPEVVVDRYASLLTERISRFQLWYAVFDLPPVAWLFGIGVGRFEFVFPLIAPVALEHKFYYLHNDLLQFVLEFGLVGSVILIATAVIAVRSIDFKSMSYVQIGAISGVGAGLLVCIGDFPLHIPGVGLVFCALLGVAATVPSQRRPKESAAG